MGFGRLTQQQTLLGGPKQGRAHAGASKLLSFALALALALVPDDRHVVVRRLVAVRQMGRRRTLGQVTPVVLPVLRRVLRRGWGGRVPEPG